MNFLEAKVIDNGHVDSSLGTIECRPPAASAPGTKVTLAIRPEQIKLQPIETATEASLSGKVVRQTYLGDTAHGGASPRLPFDKLRVSGTFGPSSCVT